MIISKDRLKTFSVFWILVSVYFLIPFIVESMSPPVWFYSLDRSIPFVWWMIIPYYSYYILILIPPIIIKEEEKIIALTKTLIQASIVCYITYLIRPITSSNALALVRPNPLSFMHNFITFDYLHQNALPSMHVSVAVIIGLAISLYNKKYTGLMLFMILLIFLATFLIKQHYLIDSITGLILGYIGFIRYKHLTSI